MSALKLTQIGNSVGVILPKELLARLKVAKGDSLFLTEAANGLTLTPYDPELDEQLKVGREFMREYREVVGKPYAGGKVAGSTEEASTNKSSVVSSAKDRPSSTASAHNIAQAATGEDRKAGADGKSLAGAVKGEYTKGVEKNISSKSTTSMKDGADLGKVAAGHGAEKKGHGETGGTNTKPVVDNK